MNILKDRRFVIAVGAALALAAGLAVAALMVARAAGPSAPPPASQAGLVVQTGRDDDVKLDPGRPLRCFVGGQFAGELALGECARRNGVATGALDVGLDPSGALAASSGVSSDITPLPPQAVTSLVSPAASPDAVAQAPFSTPGLPNAAHPPAGCLAYGPGGWVKVSAGGSLGACVQALYAGRCERPGAAAYGRWADRTLRLTAGRVEISSDNRNFHTLVEQGPDCDLPPS
ncbi:MAG TPA: hypothetical protein VII73_11415 [Caulobacteraceae bacterium]